MRIGAVQSNFTAGELSPRMLGRTDFRKLYDGALELLNFTVLPQGGAQRLSGTRFVAETKDSSKASILVDFVYSTVQAYMIEFGDAYCRFFRDRQQVLSAPLTPYEIVSPYNEAALPLIRYTQSADILFLCHPTVKPKELRRAGDTSWSFADYAFRDGPYLDANTTEGWELSPSAVTGAGITIGTTTRSVTGGSWSGGTATITIGSHPFKVGNTVTVSGVSPAGYNGSVTITGIAATTISYAVASNPGAWSSGGTVGIPTFVSTDVGRHVRIRAATGGSATVTNASWSATDGGTATLTIGAHSFSVGARIQVSGMNPSAYDGTYVITAKSATTISYYLHGYPGLFVSGGTVAGYGVWWGWATITAYTSAYAVTADVGSDFGAITPSTEWRLGAWSDTTGWPRSVAFHQERLYFASTTSQPQTVWGSCVGDYDNMAPTETDGVVLDTSAVNYTINDDKVNDIKWLASFSRGLGAGSDSGEFIITSGSSTEPITPSNITAFRQSTRGSRDGIKAAQIDASILYVQRSGSRLMEMAYSLNQDQLVSNDMSLLSEHLTSSSDHRIANLAVQREPSTVIWSIRDDGLLLGLTFLREQEVVAWSRRKIGGSFGDGDAVVESIAVMPDEPDELLWMIVKRTIDGDTVRYVEFMEDRFDDGAAQEDAFFVDCGLTYSGAATTTITGLGHLEGETVSILANGAVHPDRVVASSSVTLDTPTTKAQVGLPCPARLKTIPFETPIQVYDSRGRQKHIDRVVFRFDRTLGGYAGLNDYSLNEILFRDPSVPMGDPPPLFSGLKDLPGFSIGWTLEPSVLYVQNQPLPVTILNVTAFIGVNNE